MRSRRDEGPLIVQTGVLSQGEFDDLSVVEQVDVERTAADLVRLYGDEVLTRHPERHRADLRIIGYL